MCLLDTGKTSIKKNSYKKTILYLEFFQYGRQRSSRTSRRCLYCPWNASAKSATEPFSHHSPAPSRRPLGWGWGQPFAAARLSNSKNIVQDGQEALTIIAKDHLAHSQLLLLHLLVKYFVYPPGWLLWGLQILVKSAMNHFSKHIMGLSKFHDTLLPVILNFSGIIGCGSLSSEISLICCHQFLLLCLFIIAYSAFSSRRCHGRPSLHFLESSEAFPGCGTQFHEIAITKNGRG